MQQTRMPPVWRFDFSLCQPTLGLVLPRDRVWSGKPDLTVINANRNLERDPTELLKIECRRMLVKNDGHSFREEDWQRLKRIAKGNPD